MENIRSGSDWTKPVNVSSYEFLGRSFDDVITNIDSTLLDFDYRIE